MIIVRHCWLIIGSFVAASYMDNSHHHRSRSRSRSRSHTPEPSDPTPSGSDVKPDHIEVGKKRPFSEGDATASNKTKRQRCKDYDGMFVPVVLLIGLQCTLLCFCSSKLCLSCEPC